MLPLLFALKTVLGLLFCPTEAMLLKAERVIGNDMTEMVFSLKSYNFKNDLRKGLLEMC